MENAKRHLPYEVATAAHVTVARVKSMRVIALSGRADYADEGFLVERAAGVIEVMGARTAGHTPVLKIGFTDSPPVLRYTLAETEHELLGTLLLPTSCFSPYLAIATSPSACFRLGNAGALNALATDSSFLE